MQGMKPGHVPLERAISKLGIASRSQARKSILAGVVRVNGIVRIDPEYPVIPEKSKIVIGEESVFKVEPRSFMLYKPKGVVTTLKDEKNRPTVMSLIKEFDIHLSPVGRLDWATSGLLILTNDTRLAAMITDPANRIRRTYLVSVRGKVTEDEAEKLRQGVQEDGDLLQAEELVLRKVSEKESHLTVILTEGKNREIRRLFAAIKHEVTRLKRVGYGDLGLGSLQPGEYRELYREDLRLISPMLGEKPGRAPRE